MKKIFIMMFASLMLFSVAGFLRAEDAPEVDADGYKTAASAGFVFKWRVSGEKLDCIVRAATEGWLAVGFNTGRAMDGANMIIGFVDKKGVVVIEDQYGKGHSHKKDKIQNIENLFGEEHVGNTELRFTIPLDSGDKQDMILKPGQKYNIIMATSNKDSLTSWHKKHTFVVITL